MQVVGASCPRPATAPRPRSQQQNIVLALPGVLDRFRCTTRGASVQHPDTATSGCGFAPLGRQAATPAQDMPARASVVAITGNQGVVPGLHGVDARPLPKRHVAIGPRAPFQRIEVGLAAGDSGALRVRDAVTLTEPSSLHRGCGKRDTGQHRRPAPYSGMLSCFFQGFSTVLLRSMLSERHSRRRVWRGRITSSM